MLAKRARNLGWMTVLVAALGAQGVLASAEPTAALTQTGLSPSSAAKLLDRMYFNYFAFFHGGTLSEPTSARLVDKNGKPKSGVGMNFDSTIVAAYKITPEIGVGPELNFLYEPVFGHGFTLNDSGARIFHNHLVRTGGFNLYGNFVIQAPTSQASRDRDQFLGLKTTPIPTYTFVGTPWMIGSFTEAKAYLGAKTGKTFKLSAVPFVSYKLNDSFALNLMYEVEAHHLKNKPTFDFTTHQTNLQTGFKWNFTRKIWVNPYLSLLTGDKIMWKNTSLNATLSATL